MSDLFPRYPAIISIHPIFQRVELLMHQPNHLPSYSELFSLSYKLDEKLAKPILIYFLNINYIMFHRSYF